MEWITDRLPDKNGKYLVTGRQGGISILSYTDGSWYRKWAVMAWMPLPEPYKAESEVEDSDNLDSMLEDLWNATESESDKSADTFEKLINSGFYERFRKEDNNADSD